MAQGRVWTGREALGAGLVDRLGGLDAALARRAGAGPHPRGRRSSVVVLPERKGLLETLLERQEEDVARAGARPARGLGLLRWARRSGDRGPIARVPFELAVR